jgi:hypothetical protein
MGLFGKKGPPPPPSVAPPPPPQEQPPPPPPAAAAASIESDVLSQRQQAPPPSSEPEPEPGPGLGGQDNQVEHAADGHDQELAMLYDFAGFYDVDLEQQPHLLDAIREAAAASLPPEWAEIEGEDGIAYFHNSHTGETTWEHPLDGPTRQCLEKAQQAHEKAQQQQPQQPVQAQAAVEVAPRQEHLLATMVEQLQEQLADVRGERKELRRQKAELESVQQQMWEKLLSAQTRLGEAEAEVQRTRASLQAAIEVTRILCRSVILCVWRCVWHRTAAAAVAIAFA